MVFNIRFRNKFIYERVDFVQCLTSQVVVKDGQICKAMMVQCDVVDGDCDQ